MGRLSSIEEALIQINGTVFQELCDSFLVLRNENYSAFSRTGSQSGKQKTVKGNPDSFFLLPSGEYLYVEHTIRSQNQKSKLEKDIKSCLEDAEESNISLEKIREIILCTNFNLDTDEIQQIRSNIWNTLDKKFDESESAVFDVLKNFHKGEPDPQEEILQYDLPYVLDIINENLSNESFEHCHYVHELITWYERKEITDRSFNELKNRFTNRTYEVYREIKWNFFEDVTIDSEDHREYDKKKEERIRNKFVFNSIEEFNEFYENYIQVENYLSGSFLRSLGFVIHENFKQNFRIGYEILEYFIFKDNKVNYLPIQVFSDCLDDKKKEEQIWKLISSYEYNRKTEWNLHFFKYLKHKELEKENFLIRFFKWFGIYSNNKITVHNLLSVYKSIKNPITLHLTS